MQLIQIRLSNVLWLNEFLRGITWVGLPTEVFYTFPNYAGDDEISE